MSAVIRVVVVTAGWMVSATARADVAPRDIGGCSKVGATCELDGRPGKCQTKTRIQHLPKPGGGVTSHERKYVACVPTGPAPAKAEVKSAVAEPAEPVAPVEPARGPVPTLPPEPVRAPIEAPAAAAPPAAPVVEVSQPAPEGGSCRVAAGGPGLGLLLLVLRRRRRR